MSNEVVGFLSIKEKIAERVKAEFANLIPDDQWKVLVQSAWEDFTKQPTNGSPSILQKIFYEEFEKIARPLISAELSQLSYSNYIDGKQVAGETLKKFVAEHWDELFQSVMKTMIENIVFNAVNTMRRNF